MEDKDVNDFLVEVAVCQRKCKEQGDALERIEKELRLASNFKHDVENMERRLFENEQSFKSGNIWMIGGIVFTVLLSIATLFLVSISVYKDLMESRIQVNKIVNDIENLKFEIEKLRRDYETQGNATKSKNAN